jgi:SprT protein
MNQLQRNSSILQKYLPEKAVTIIADWIYTYDFKLKIKKTRSTKYGDYRPPHNGSNHIISINHDLNKYAFLITLVHEIAHLTNYNRHKNTVKPHGEEWKLHYKLLMNQFLHPDFFPDDIIYALRKYMSNPAASSCSDINLLRILKRYDTNRNNVLMEQLNVGDYFIYANRKFKVYEIMRKRYKCKELPGNKMYLFHPIAEVTLHLPEEKNQD